MPWWWLASQGMLGVLTWAVTKKMKQMKSKLLSWLFNIFRAATCHYTFYYCWWKKSCTSWYAVYPTIYKVLYIQQVVVWDFWTINSSTLYRRKGGDPILYWRTLFGFNPLSRCINGSEMFPVVTPSNRRPNELCRSEFSKPKICPEFSSNKTETAACEDCQYERYTYILDYIVILLAWNPKQPFISGCFNWMIPNLYIGNGCFTKHPFINGCLGFLGIIIQNGW